jgi:hypothetical protein
MERDAAGCGARTGIRVISAIALAARRSACRVVVDPHHPSPLDVTDNCTQGGVEDVMGA